MENEHINIYNAKNYFLALTFYHLVLLVYVLFFIYKMISEHVVLIYFVPIIFFVILSIIGVYFGLKKDIKAINYFIIAQILQIIILQFNGFTYLLLVGQWLILSIDTVAGMDILYGFLRIQYTFLFHHAENVFFGINVVPIIFIAALMKVEAMLINEKEKKSNIE